MSEINRLKKHHVWLAQELEKLQESYRTKAIELGQISRLPKSDPAYSAARMESLERELEKLADERASLQADLDETELAIRLLEAPKPPQEQRAAAIARDKKLSDLNEKLNLVQTRLEAKRLGLGAAVVAGGDPGALVADITKLEQTQTGLLAGLAELRK